METAQCVSYTIGYTLILYKAIIFLGIDDEPLDGIGHNIFKRTHDHS